MTKGLLQQKHEMVTPHLEQEPAAPPGDQQQGGFTQVGEPIMLVAGEPFLLQAYLYDFGGVGHMSVGVRMPPHLSGHPAWNSVAQKQVIAWSGAYDGVQWRLAAEWTRANQTAAKITVSGPESELLNPRNGILLSHDGYTAAFSISANETWVQLLARDVVRVRSGGERGTAYNSDVHITGSAAEGSIEFLFVTDDEVNEDLLLADRPLTAELVRSLTFSARRAL